MPKYYQRILIILVLLVCCRHANGQVLQFPDTLHKKRLKGVIIAESALYTISMAGLYQLWYSKHSSDNFHVFDDSNEWLQVDKAGHVMTSYYLGRIGHDALRWSGVSKKKSTWYGGLLGFGYLGGVELLDGFSKGWGFSWSDMASNAIGSGLFIGQQLAWNEQRIVLKYSYHSTSFPQYRPNLLGSSWNEKMLKDYNGQTYWASFNIQSFASSSRGIPNWLNVAIGYGANGMVGGEINPESYKGVSIPFFKRQRQFYLSPDIDLTRIKTRKKWVKVGLTLLSFIKIPAPTLSVDESGIIKGYWIYF